MVKNNLSMILKNLNKLAYLMKHPAVERGLSDYVDELSIRIAKDSSGIQELENWFNGMGSFIDNEYFDLYYFQPHSSKPAIRVKEWDSALRKYMKWRKDFCKIVIPIAMQLKELGHESSGLDRWLDILKKELKKPYLSPHEINIAVLEKNMHVLRDMRKKK